MNFLFLSKVPINECPLGSTAGHLWRELPVYRTFLHIFQIPHKKISLNKKCFPSLKGPRKGVPLQVPQKRGLYRNRLPFPDPYLAYHLGSPIKEPSLQVSLHRAPSKRVAPLPERSNWENYTDRVFVSCIFVETECRITVWREYFHQTEYRYRKVLEAERREVQYWKCGTSGVLTVLSTGVLLSGGREREIYVLQEMTSHVALSPLTLFCDIDTIHCSSKFPSPPHFPVWS